KLEFGGRNYFKNSDFQDGITHWHAFNNEPQSSIIVEDGILKTTKDNVNGFGQRDAMSEDTSNVISVKAKGEGEFRARWGQGSSSYVQATNEFKWYYFKLSDIGNGNAIVETRNGIIEIERIKLEKGTK